MESVRSESYASPPEAEYSIGVLAVGSLPETDAPDLGLVINLDIQTEETDQLTVTMTATAEERIYEWPANLTPAIVEAMIQKTNKGQARRNRLSDNDVTVLMHMLSEPTRDYNVSELHALLDGSPYQKSYTLKQLRRKLAAHELGFSMGFSGATRSRHYWLSAEGEGLTLAAKLPAIDYQGIVSAATRRKKYSAPKNPEWGEPSTCKKVDPELFYKDSETRDTTLAVAVCMGCAALSPCLGYTLGAKEEFGVWGGLTEKQRSEIRRVQREGRTVEEIAVMIAGMHTENKERVAELSLLGANG